MSKHTNTLSKSFFHSWVSTDGIMSTTEALDWIHQLNNTVEVNIRKTKLSELQWFYDNESGQIVNERRSFFQISGLRYGKIEQPILIQKEIGHLGIICKPINGILHFLMQAKIEPGNINKVQLSPTIQATKSNFTQAHGGAKPSYLEWFHSADKYEIIVDQIQSEQSTRFLGKRNRNIIIMLDEETEIEVLPSHNWLTLGQIKQMMRIDNLVNMDARTVLSCIPFYKFASNGIDTPLVRSITDGEQPDILPKIYHYINNHKMFNSEEPVLFPLYSLYDWETVIHDGVEEFVCKNLYPFKIIFCDISIEGREVMHWSQPLFEAIGKATFGLFTRVNNGVQEFLVQAKQEIGCFDKIEIGPTVQLEATEKPINDIEKLFDERYEARRSVKYDVVLSEEGGRFYHEQNNNIVIEIEPNLIDKPPQGYWWCTYRTLNMLVQHNNTLNIQLRNLLSILELEQ